jgi:hypothetical protein
MNYHLPIWIFENMRQNFCLLFQILLLGSSLAYSQKDGYIISSLCGIITNPFQSEHGLVNDGGIRVGLSAGFFTGLNFGFSTGVVYEHLKLLEDYNTNLPWNADEQHFEFNCLGMPVRLNVVVLQRNSHSIFISTGLDILYLSSMNIWLSNNNGTIGYNESQFDIDHWLHYFNLGVSYSYNFWKNLFISFNPTARWCLNEVYGIRLYYPEYSRFSLLLDCSIGVLIR